MGCKKILILSILISQLIIVGCSESELKTEITANFTINKEVAEGGEIELEPEQEEYGYKEEVKIKAVADEGWEFSSWSGSLSGDEEVQRVLMESDKNIIAEFEEVEDNDEREEFKLELRTNEGGLVESNPVKEKYKAGTEVELEAIADKGWEFSYWEIEGLKESKENPWTKEIDSNVRITAIFTKASYPLEIETMGQGKVELEPEADDGKYKAGEIVTVSAKPEQHWGFDYWSDDLSGTEAEKEIEIWQAKNIKAVFTSDIYRINTDIESGQGIINLSPQKDKYSYDDRVEIEAVAKEDYKFIGWSGDLSGDEQRDELIVNENLSIKAEFSKMIDLSDSEFEADIREKLDQQSGVITINDLEKIKNLELNFNNLESITEIKYMSNLKKLELASNQISDIDSLAELEKLESLILRFNDISDISSLTNLNNLKQLNIRANEIERINDLASLSDLKVLNLASNDISDISSLADLNNLTELNLARNKIKEIDALANLTKLEKLDLSDNNLDLTEGSKAKEIITTLEEKGCEVNY